MNKSGLLVIGMLLWGGGLVLAQKAANPCVKSPPPGSAWSVIIEHTDVAQKDPEPDLAGEKSKFPVPVRLVVKSGKNGVIAGQIMFSDEHQEVYYITEGLILVKAPNSGKIVVLPAETTDPLNLRVGTFPGVNWVSKAWEKEKEQEKERDKKGNDETVYYMYEEMTGDPPTPGTRLEAWIRKDDLYPAKVKIGGDVTYRFEKMGSYSEDVVLPEAYAPALAKVKKEQSVLELIRKANAGPSKIP